MMRGNDKLTLMGFLCIAVGFLLFGFAALSPTLTINGIASVSKPSWDIEIKNLGEAVTAGNAVEVSSPKIAYTTVKDLSIGLKMPDDFISYSFDVVNNGTYDARVREISVSQPTCVGSGSTANSDATLVCQEVVYTLKYGDGRSVQANDLLKAGETQRLVLTISYGKNRLNVEDTAKSEVTVAGLGMTIIYSQV